MRIFGEYELVRELGSGASATVWHAIYRSWKPCAIKIFSGDATKPENAHLFRNEVRTAMSFSHGGVVQVFDAGETDGQLWLACEWIDGVSLEAFSRQLWRRGGKWPLELAAHVLGRILVALSYIHEFTIAGRPMHVIHRDVKPANVLVSASGEVKLTDFGIAKMWADDSASLFRGTVRYASCDHYRFGATQKSDLFGAGAILHELLANEPFRGRSTSPNELYAALHEEYDPGELDAPASLETLRRKLLAPSDERIASAREAHALLMAWPQYRPGDFGLAKVFSEVMGRAGSSGVTLHEGFRALPDSPLPLRYRNRDTVILAPLVAEPDEDAPVARRRQLTELVSPPSAPVEPAVEPRLSEADTAPLRVNFFFRRSATPPAAVDDAVTHDLGPSGSKRR